MPGIAHSSTRSKNWALVFHLLDAFFGRPASGSYGMKPGPRRPRSIVSRRWAQIMIRPSGFRAAVWLAALGVSFQALWPLVSAAAPRRAPLPSQIICSIAGVKLFHFGDEPRPPSDRHPVRHCVLCSLGNATLALPGGAPPGVAPAPEFAARLRAEHASVYPKSVLLFLAPPRAPPAFS